MRQNKSMNWVGEVVIGCDSLPFTVKSISLVSPQFSGGQNVGKALPARSQLHRLIEMYVNFKKKMLNQSEYIFKTK